MMNYIRRKLMNALVSIQGKSLDRLRDLSKWQWLGKNEMMSLQKSRLKLLLSHAYNKVPYYHNLLKEYTLIDKNGRIELDRFKYLPLLNKSLIHENFEKLIANDIGKKKYDLRLSGGSTGRPVKFIQDQNYYDWRLALKMLYDSWTGYHPGTKKITLWGSESDLKREKISLKMIGREKLRNNLTLNSFSMALHKVCAVPSTYP